jgi:hypothetical protein
MAHRQAGDYPAVRNLPLLTRIQMYAKIINRNENNSKLYLPTSINRTVREGCPLPPAMFNTECIFIHKSVNTLFFAGD